MIQSPNRLLATVFGTVLLLVGLVGFFVSTPYPFATPQGGVVIGLFGSNGLLGSVHVVTGGILLLSGLIGARTSKIFGVIIGLGFFVLSLYGFFGDHTAGNVFALNVADNLLHLVIGLGLLVAGLTTDRLFRPVAAA
ncbi:DUF4383 domain-containing protein [Frondihabitans cladoniiphilus]|uniref:DUF4383 domain-containing protein n=1 Tax=Frondihabitans cladoniiphilus TaxID=715785 RepID=A0ABP8WAZ5_9MICO